MPFSTILLILAVLSCAAFILFRRQALLLAGGRAAQLHSLPGHYAWFGVMRTCLPGLSVLIVWTMIGNSVLDTLVIDHLPADQRPLPGPEQDLFLNDVKNLAAGLAASSTSDIKLAATRYYLFLTSQAQWIIFILTVGLSAIVGVHSLTRLSAQDRARDTLDQATRLILITCSTVAILTTLGIILSLLFESIRFFGRISLFEFLFGLQWSPQTALREDQVGSSGAFGAMPLFAGTLLISFIAMLVAVPVGLMSAIYMTQFAGPRFRRLAKPMLEILAGIPTVVYGFFAALVVAPLVRSAGQSIGLDVASESALAAGLVMGIMIIPFMSSLSDDAISAVPRSMRDGSLALGATRYETIAKVLVPAALPGIVGAFLLSISRAIGETMIVVMAAGLTANLTANPLDAVTTVTVQIVTLLTGDQEFDSAKTLSAFALGLVLFGVTLVLNFIALHVVRKYREVYE